MTIQLPQALGALVPEFSFGDRLRKARELAGYDRTAIGEVLGIHRQTIARYESDLAKPSSSVVVVWSLLTQVDLSWIQTGQCTPRDSNSEPTGLESEIFFARSERLSEDAVSVVYKALDSKPGGFESKRRRPRGPALSSAAAIADELGFAL
jgi:transcriptional regulator with XRE-family HTH domain